MASIMTNTAAMAALASLRHTDAQLVKTERAISTGYRISQASDNAAYWSIATTMRSDNSSQATVQDALGLGASTIDVAYTGINSALEAVNMIKDKLVAAREPGVSLPKIQSDIKELQSQLEGILASSSFSGENWINTDPTKGNTRDIVSSFNRDANGGISIALIKINIETSRLGDTNPLATAATKTGILDKQFATAGTFDGVTATGYEASILTLDITGTGLNTADIDSMIQIVDAGAQEITTAAADMGAAKKRVDLQETFITNLMDAVERGVGTLVDADMTKESTRLSALQTQQQLGVQSLSIANAGAQSILALFK